MEQGFLNKYLEVLKFVNEKIENNRSPHKVNLIHGQIAKDIKSVLGNDYLVITKETHNKEEIINGRYIDKKVDIVIKKKNKIIAGIAIKNPINSYFKNKNNYFENMLGETANIKSNGFLYFQIIIFPHKIPDWKGKGKNQTLRKMDVVNEDKLSVYLKLAKDDPTKMFHTPTKTLLLIIKDNINKHFSKGSKEEYQKIVSKLIVEQKLKLEFLDFENNAAWNALIINDYSSYIEKICYLIIGTS